MAYDLQDLLKAMVDNGGSDLHLHVGVPPCLRIAGKIIQVEGEALTPADTAAMAKTIMPPMQAERLERDGGCDFGFMYGSGDRRFRANVFRSQGSHGLVLRLITNKLYTIDQLRLPNTIKSLLGRSGGLILVACPTGFGKSTTLAAMIDWINNNETGHIITLEEPIEFIHEPKKCVISQREVLTDVPSFAEGIRAALRQDPDVILVGEMRDLETISAAVTAAETGHLVLASLHTTGAGRTVDRIIDAFPDNAREQIRTQLAASLAAIISQVLLKTKDGRRVAAFEIMVRTDGIAAKIRDKKTYQIASDIETGISRGMRTLDSDLITLYKQGEIAESEILTYCQDVEAMKARLKLHGGNVN